MDPQYKSTLDRQRDQTASSSSTLVPEMEGEFADTYGPRPAQEADAYSAEEEYLVEQRLKNLGYL